jgi:hypothetical protein
MGMASKIKGSQGYRDIRSEAVMSRVEWSRKKEQLCKCSVANKRAWYL